VNQSPDPGSVPERLPGSVPERLPGSGPERLFGPQLLSPQAFAINLVGLGLLTLGTSGEAHPGLAGRHLAALLLLVGAVGAWVVWAHTRFRPARPQVTFSSIAAMTLSGGALTAFAPLAITFVGVGAMAATISWDLDRAAILAIAGPAASAISIAGAGRNLGVAVGSLSGSLAGAVTGMSRRESQQRTAQAASIQIAEARAEVLAARNHLARELHDVLAHTLSALSLQLQALDALIADRPVDSAVAEQLAQIRRLVREGLDEARGAVQALREDVPDLDTRLAKLASERHAALEIQGDPRDLPPDVSLALYRVAQEALTNVMKHAPGARAEMRLDYSDKEVGISISNPTSTNGDAALASTGGGYGIQGIRERVLLLGGNVKAGPTPDGWTVSAEVPA
jgi:signal transduction histidine kinase